MKINWRGLFFIVIVSILLWYFYLPFGLTIVAWHSTILFIATIASIVIKTMPLGTTGFIALTLFALTNPTGATTSSISMANALSEFSNPILWLVVVAFLIARGFIKTGLGKRIALIFVSLFGQSTLRLAYSLAAADCMLAPAIPSNTARCGGIFYPVVTSLANNFDSYPQDSSRSKLGTFLIVSTTHVNDITSALFMTAYSGNLISTMLATNAGIQLTWGKWFIAACMPCFVSLCFIPFIVYKLTKPEIQQTPNAPALAKAALREMGTITFNEKIMMGTFILLLILWIFNDILKIDATQTAFIGLSILLLSGVLSWDDVKSEKGAWDTLIWFSALMMMANVIKKLGFTAWLGEQIGSIIGSSMAGTHWIFILIILNIAYFYIHYFFASGNAQIVAFYSVFVFTGKQLGVPLMPIALTLLFTSALYCSLTPYASARGPILFGSGYVPNGVWWRVGFIVSIINQLIFTTIGLLWWKFLGYY